MELTPNLYNLFQLFHKLFFLSKQLKKFYYFNSLNNRNSLCHIVVSSLHPLWVFSLLKLHNLQQVFYGSGRVVHCASPSHQGKESVSSVLYCFAFSCHKISPSPMDSAQPQTRGGSTSDVKLNHRFPKEGQSHFLNAKHRSKCPATGLLEPQLKLLCSSSHSHHRSGKHINKNRAGICILYFIDAETLTLFLLRTFICKSHSHFFKTVKTQQG